MTQTINDSKLPTKDKHWNRVNKDMNGQPLHTCALIDCHLICLHHEVSNEVTPNNPDEH
jgi:hypothetical protein